MKNKLIKTLERTLSLLLVFLLFSAAAVPMGSLWGEDLAKPNADKETENTATGMPSVADVPASVKSALGLAEARWLLCDTVSWTVQSAVTGQALGRVVSSARIAPEVAGFAGPVPVYVYIDSTEVVQNIIVADNAETPDFQRRAAVVLDAWKGKRLEQTPEVKVDAVSGATYTSNALIRNVEATLALCRQTSHNAVIVPAIGWAKTLCVLGILALGVAAAFVQRRKRWMRPVLLLLNVVVVGFWCGQFLSLSLLRGWLSAGFEPLTILPTLAMLLVAVLMPFFGKPAHYCQWVCPLGALQELLYMFPWGKIEVPAHVFRVLNHIRLGVFAVLLMGLWLGFGAFLLDYEPFMLFSLESLSLPVLILAFVIVMAGLFVPRPWCKTLCPLGEALHLASRAD